jgi:hypothetical protein
MFEAATALLPDDCPDMQRGWSIYKNGLPGIRSWNGSYKRSKTKGGWYGPLAIPGVQPVGSFLEEGVLSVSAELGPMVTLPSKFC